MSMPWYKQEDVDDLVYTEDVGDLVWPQEDRDSLLVGKGRPAIPLSFSAV